MDLYTEIEVYDLPYDSYLSLQPLASTVDTLIVFSQRNFGILVVS